MADLRSGEAFNKENRAVANPPKDRLARADFLGSLSHDVRKRVERLLSLQRLQDERVERLPLRRSDIKARFRLGFMPWIYELRYLYVSGKLDVEGAANQTAANTEEENVKGVPAFWLTALKNHSVLADEISEHDEEALEYLEDIRSSWTLCLGVRPRGFKLEFHFSTNPFFRNSILTKTYYIDKHECIPNKVIGTKIEWYAGKCLTAKLHGKRHKMKAIGAKPIAKTVNCKSFFNFFCPPQVYDDDEDNVKHMTKGLEKQMEKDYYVGLTIKREIIPRAVLWFIGEGVDGLWADVLEREEFESDEDSEEDEEEQKKGKRPIMMDVN